MKRLRTTFQELIGVGDGIATGLVSRMTTRVWRDRKELYIDVEEVYE